MSHFQNALTIVVQNPDNDLQVVSNRQVIQDRTTALQQQIDAIPLFSFSYSLSDEQYSANLDRIIEFQEQIDDVNDEVLNRRADGETVEVINQPPPPKAPIRHHRMRQANRVGSLIGQYEALNIN